ncbi:MAG: hypothetical protein IT260_07780 [Saprospiraceae bacterium]|nr:hypothetical protein [Saprospiraceae bacterium]
MQQEKQRKRSLPLLLLALLIGVPLLLYLPGELSRRWNRIAVKDAFCIEYLDMYRSVSLWNGTQGFVGHVQEAHWNADSLVVRGEAGCFLIVFGQTAYKEDMIQLDCANLDHVLQNGPVEHFIKEK